MYSCSCNSHRFLRFRHIHQSICYTICLLYIHHLSQAHSLSWCRLPAGVTFRFPARLSSITNPSRPFLMGCIFRVSRGGEREKGRGKKEGKKEGKGRNNGGERRNKGKKKNHQTSTLPTQNSPQQVPCPAHSYLSLNQDQSTKETIISGSRAIMLPWYSQDHSQVRS